MQEPKPCVVEQALEDPLVGEKAHRDVADDDPRNRGREEEHRAEEPPAADVAVDQERNAEWKRDRNRDRKDHHRVVLEHAGELRVVEEMAVVRRPDPGRRKAVPVREAVVDRLPDREQQERADNRGDGEREEDARPAPARSQTAAAGARESDGLTYRTIPSGRPEARRASTSCS